MHDKRPTIDIMQQVLEIRNPEYPDLIYALASRIHHC